MNLKTPFLFSFYFLLLQLTAQNVTVKDEATGKPIADVFVYHENKTNVSYSNAQGIAHLSEFPSGLIFLQHPSYYERSIAFFGNEMNINLSEKVVSFNEVVVSANKWEQEGQSVSQQTTSINKKAIDFHNPQTAADMLAGTGEVFVQKSQLGGGSPKLRGFAANSVLLVVDGVRMNNAIFRSGNLQNVINIDPNALQSAEVVFGPGSVIYGSDALGGVMGFLTIDPKWARGHSPVFSSNGLIRYSSAANERTGHIDFSIAKEKATFFHSTTFTSLDDLKAGRKRNGRYKGEFERRFTVERIDGEDQLTPNSDMNVQRPSGYDLFNTINKIKVRLGKSMDVGYGFYYSTTSDIPRYDNLTETIENTDSLAAAEWYYGPQDWQMHNLRLNSYKPTAAYDQARVTLAYQKFEESRNDRDFGDDRLRTRTEHVDMYSLSVDLDKEFEKSNIYYGADFFHNDIRSSAFRRNIENGETSSTSSRYPDGGSGYTSSAVYGSWVNSLSDQLVFNVGARLNLIHLSATTTDSSAIAHDAEKIDLNNSSINGALGVAWNFKENQKLSYNLSTGFRSPNIDDIGKLFEVGSSIIVPNPNLRPEYTVSNEISYERKTNRFLGKIVAFYSRLFDAIIDSPYTTNNGQFELNGLDVFAKVNTDEAETYGGSLVVQAELSKFFALEHTLGWVGGKDLTNGQPLRHTTPLFGKSSLIFKQKKLRSEFFIQYNGDRYRSDIPVSEIDRKPHLYTDSGTPGWYTLNIKTGYQFNEYLSANAGVENVLNQHYRPYASGISAPRRNIVVALRAGI